jgi:hypothetical protein
MHVRLSNGRAARDPRHFAAFAQMTSRTDTRTATWLSLSAPFLVLAGVIVHESLHALAVVADGGHVLGWSVVPGRGWLLHDGVARGWLVAIAPFVIEIAIAAAAVRFVTRPLPLAALTLVPLVDLSMGFAGLFLGDPTADLHRVLAGHEAAASVAIAVIFPGFGMLLARRLRARWFPPVYAALLIVPWPLCYAIIR